MATTTVIYPKGVSFKMDYYLSTHMPLVQEKWGKYGLKSWKVIEYPDDAEFKVQATLEWADIEAQQKAGGSPEAKEVFGDVPNFSDKQPTVLSGSVVKTS